MAENTQTITQPPTPDTSDQQLPNNSTIAENTSGQGKDAAIPQGVKGWSWGAFFLTVIWSISNRVWIGLLTLIPYVGIIMAFVLGFKGREWAWQAKHWDSVEQFNKVQHRWSVWGVILIGFALLAILITFLIVVNSPLGREINY